MTHLNPDWLGALTVALVRPTGAPERRHGQGQWQQRAPAQRPCRVTDDLAWLRVAFCDPESNGLRPLSRRGAGASWVPDDHGVDRLRRLRDRGVLEAAGFRPFEDEDAHAERSRSPIAGPDPSFFSDKAHAGEPSRRS